MTHEQPQLTEVASPPASAESSAVTSAGDAEQPPIASPRIWVGSLVDYNDGLLHGAWIEAAREPEEIEAAIQPVLASSPWTTRTGQLAEEWGIFDYDNFGACRLDQHENLGWVSAVAKGIAAHGLAFAAWADVVEEPELLADFDEAYIGHYDSLHAYVEQLINDLGYDQLLDRAVPPSLRPYVKIDVAATAQDLGSDLHALPAREGGIWIFNVR
jgi:antirestriction protein